MNTTKRQAPPKHKKPFFKRNNHTPRHDNRELDSQISEGRKRMASEEKNMMPVEKPLNEYEKHRVRVKNKRISFYQCFTVDQQELLERELVNWPVYPNGNPFPKIRNRIMNLLNLDPNSSRAMELCNMWFEYLGWSVVGRHTWVDDFGRVWGPSPFGESEHDFPYSDAVYDEDLDTWLLPEDHAMFPLFVDEAKKYMVG